MTTVEQVKAELPDVKVRIASGEIVNGQTAGRKEKFCSVFIDYGKQFHRIEYSWEAIAHAVNTGAVLTA